MTSRDDWRRGLPRLPIFYTIDQVAALLALTEETLIASYLWVQGKDVGVYHPRYLLAVNFNVARRVGTVAEQKKVEYRVSESEFIRWLAFHRLWLYPADPGGPVDPAASAPQHDPSPLTQDEGPKAGEDVTVVEATPRGYRHVR